MTNRVTAKLATSTYLIDIGSKRTNGAVWQLSAGDRLNLRLVAATACRVEAEDPSGHCVGRLAPEAAWRVAPLLAAGRALSAIVTALVPRPLGGPPRVQLAVGRRRHAA